MKILIIRIMTIIKNNNVNCNANKSNNKIKIIILFDFIPTKTLLKDLIAFKNKVCCLLTSNYINIFS